MLLRSFDQRIAEIYTILAEENRLHTSQTPGLMVSGGNPLLSVLSNLFFLHLLKEVMFDRMIGLLEQKTSVDFWVKVIGVYVRWVFCSVLYEPLIKGAWCLTGWLVCLRRRHLMILGSKVNIIDVKNFKFTSLFEGLSWNSKPYLPSTCMYVLQKNQNQLGINPFALQEIK